MVWDVAEIYCSEGSGGNAVLFGLLLRAKNHLCSKVTTEGGLRHINLQILNPNLNTQKATVVGG